MKFYLKRESHKISPKRAEIRFRIEKEYDIIDNFAKKEIEWFASPWDLKSLEFLKKYKTNYNKVVCNVNSL